MSKGKNPKNVLFCSILNAPRRKTLAPLIVFDKLAKSIIWIVVSILNKFF
jgi:hypothetical protein